MAQAIILGIETSCDETAAALVKDGREILSNIINSQVEIHGRFGGVVPEVASRKHIENIGTVVSMAFRDAGLSYGDIDAVAVTNRPGLIGALLVGVSFAKAFAFGLGKPLIAVNHLHAHIYASLMEHFDKITFPAICLVVSGGHTSLLFMQDSSHFRNIGETRDDAAGEAFDKVARFLGLGYPGGPAVQKAALSGTAGIVKLPRVFLNQDYEFSFSGLKTATMNEWKKLERKNMAHVNDMAAEFQAALVEILVEKTIKAAIEYNAKTILLAGGVAANRKLREVMQEKAEAKNLPVFFPALALCTDNAAMVAGCAFSYWQKGQYAPLSLNAYASQ
ncbi:MAG: tRNA (adenosine(37)-N6)-threonylcarbamoyltransferase complex transferase subunit TsaD [Syntrophomonadaceae bacterium]|jgi:N6-L-threonylcarbamoyladenine synthase